MPRTKKRNASQVLHFRCYAPGAQHVFLAGDFNEWRSLEFKMSREDSDTWALDLPLEPGRYEYKFLVDGQWCCGQPDCDGDSPECERCVPNLFGTTNRFVEVS